LHTARTDGRILGTELDPLLVQYALAEFRRFSAFCNTTLHFCVEYCRTGIEYRYSTEYRVCTGSQSTRSKIRNDVRGFKASFFCPLVWGVRPILSVLPLRGRIRFDFGLVRVSGKKIQNSDLAVVRIPIRNIRVVLLAFSFFLHKSQQ
jgi:hypothetical protein